jgi:hypothetical protein
VATRMAVMQQVSTVLAAKGLIPAEVQTQIKMVCACEELDGPHSTSCLQAKLWGAFYSFQLCDSQLRAVAPADHLLREVYGPPHSPILYYLLNLQPHQMWVTKWLWIICGSKNWFGADFFILCSIKSISLFDLFVSHKGWIWNHFLQLKRGIELKFNWYLFYCTLFWWVKLCKHG